MEGHSYCYEGSRWGKIVQILMDSKCMNPVIFFDELDKVSDSYRGKDIIGILTHLIDSTQNTHFHDKYFEGVDLDLSKCLFIFSYNDESAINPILKDRMYHIHTKGYNTTEKICIARQHLLPHIQKQMDFSEGDVVFPDESLKYILNRRSAEDPGVRHFKRALETIYAKLNLLRLNPSLFCKDIPLSDTEITFPFVVTRVHIDKMLKEKENSTPASFLSMYI
jgi:ATP-dependent Lon protease